MWLQSTSRFHFFVCGFFLFGSLLPVAGETLCRRQVWDDGFGCTGLTLALRHLRDRHSCFCPSSKWDMPLPQHFERKEILSTKANLNSLKLPLLARNHLDRKFTGKGCEVEATMTQLCSQWLKAVARVRPRRGGLELHRRVPPSTSGMVDVPRVSRRPEKLQGGLRQRTHPFLLPQVQHHARLGGSGDSHAPVPLDHGRTWKTDSAEAHCRDVSISQEHLRSLACSCLPSPDPARYCKGYYPRPPSRFYLPIENKKAKATQYCNGHGVIELKCNSS